MEHTPLAAEQSPPPARVSWARVGLFYGISFGMVCLLGLVFTLARVAIG
jgi:hypothetical protein